MYILDRAVFKKAIKDKGYGTIGKLAEELSIHRNTLHYYLSGRGIFPRAFERIIDALDLNPAEIIIKKENGQIVSFQPIVPIIEKLNKDFPEVAFFLFGSRSRGKAEKYSDWDVGVYKTGGLPHPAYRKILMEKNNLVEDEPFFMDVVNLNNADEVFLKQISKDLIFLTGSLTSLMELKRKASR